jgi:NNP family nitrate/nitrite transporter-like MFS transporter
LHVTKEDTKMVRRFSGSLLVAAQGIAAQGCSDDTPAGGTTDAAVDAGATSDATATGDAGSDTASIPGDGGAEAGGGKGFALGLNAAGGNIGVSNVQLLVPLIVGWAGLGLAAGGSPTPDVCLQNAGLMWLPFIAVAVIGAALFMNNLASARSNFRDQLVITRRKHTWIMSILYIATLGSFVGYSAAFPF